MTPKSISIVERPSILRLLIVLLFSCTASSLLWAQGVGESSPSKVPAQRSTGTIDVRTVADVRAARRRRRRHGPRRGATALL